jgi:predicted nucleic acid-binding protein
LAGKYLLDTCVISESRRKSINPGLKKWLSAIPNAAMFMSVLSIGEIRNGIERLAEGERKDRLALWLEYELTAWFEDRILTLGFDVLNCWGILCAHHRTLPAIDSLLAATAVHHHLVLVTRNIKGFRDTAELELLNPWD